MLWVCLSLRVISGHYSISLGPVSELLGRQTEAQRGKWSHAAEAELQNHDGAEGGEGQRREGQRREGSQREKEGERALRFRKVCVVWVCVWEGGYSLYQQVLLSEPQNMVFPLE